MKKRATFILATVTVWLLVEGGNRQRVWGADSQHKNIALSEETRALLERSEKFVLLSIEPNPSARDRETNHQKRFHNYPILGQTEISEPKGRSELLTALYGGIKKDDGRRYACFAPRHGIIAIAATNRVELVICFECRLVEEYLNSKRSECLMSDSPRETFNRILTEAGVPLAKQ